MELFYLFGSQFISLPWLLIGNFNQVLYYLEKRDGHRINQQHARSFANMITERAMLDLRIGRANIQERLDRALCNHIWLTQFLECTMQHLPRTRSDHLPLLLSTNKNNTPPSQSKSFKMLATWFDHPNFHELVEDN